MESKEGKKPYKVRKPRLTPKQALFLKGKLEGKNSKQAALAAGYTEQMAKNANIEVLNKPVVQEQWQVILRAAGVTEDQLAQKLKEGLEAYKVSSSLTEPDRVLPDFAVRHKYLETSLEQLGRKVQQAPQVQVNFVELLKKERQVYEIE